MRKTIADLRNKLRTPRPAGRRRSAPGRAAARSPQLGAPHAQKRRLRSARSVTAAAAPPARSSGAAGIAVLPSELRHAPLPGAFSQRPPQSPDPLRPGAAPTEQKRNRSERKASRPRSRTGRAGIGGRSDGAGRSRGRTERPAAPGGAPRHGPLFRTAAPGYLSRVAAARPEGRGTGRHSAREARTGKERRRAEAPARPRRAADSAERPAPPAALRLPTAPPCGREERGVPRRRRSRSGQSRCRPRTACGR